MALNENEIKKMMCDVGKRIYDRNICLLYTSKQDHVKS